MRSIFLLLLIITLACCNNRNTAPDLSTVKWINIDSSASYFITADGNGAYKKGDLLGIEFYSLVDKATNKNFHPPVEDSFEFKEQVPIEFITGKLSGVVNKNSEGYIRLDLLQMYGSDIRMQVYLAPPVKDDEIKNLLYFIKGMKEVSSCTYISPQDAIKKWNADNDTTWTKFIKGNPLPASIEIAFKQEYIDKNILQNISILIKNRSEYVSDILYPYSTAELIKINSRYYYIYRFKT